ncbi:hypothetical protein OCU_09220 [Mycobacterium intracellulare ATCC 13950]|uniref:Uncharacterized protein n=2 Tax=Mycobacterium intracellulare TaxID=1767 RepID=H8ISU5_MYCIA|nr:hypothetical protein OCU_09220 [Mycobacterium intracellulare ATCC 13950]AFS13057.1 7-alpha-hydroxysteroid dehydrogenase [Mycobacterium intracellulare subsp. intracellulare MTCC 9506]ETZ39056.1 hypothetical protein L843_1123 [Mycobacterium intracellulare MIN_061107_1834]
MSVTLRALPDHLPVVHLGGVSSVTPIFVVLTREEETWDATVLVLCWAS